MKVERKLLITRTVWVLSFVSLFTDIASEMLYPVMPVYLRSIGFSVLLIGILEGIAEATAGLSKGYFGNVSDLRMKRIPFIRAGYTISAIAKPLLALFTYPFWILGVRTMERLGKGIRTGARDAVLSAESDTTTKGKVFGLHRGMDTLGAAIGPALALLFLFYYPGKYRLLFLLALIPGLLAVWLTILLKEPKKKQKIVQKKWPGFLAFIQFLKHADPVYKKLVYGLWFFTLFNSSDIFLLLMLKFTGLADLQVIGVYIFYNIVYALFAYPFGVLGDKIGLKYTLMFGTFIFSLVYAGMVLVSGLYWFLLIFLFYGIYAASTESIAKAWISNLVKTKETATAIGTYDAFRSLATLIASVTAGILWTGFGPELTFMVSAIAALITFLYIGLAVKS